MTPEWRDKVLGHFSQLIEQKRRAMDTVDTLDEFRKLQGEIKSLKHCVEYLAQEMKRFYLDD